MAAAGQRELDPRQVKAREEFERMREQLTRSLERTIDPAPWRERARERVAAFERETRRRRPLTVAAEKMRVPRWAPLAAAFVLGVTTAAIAAAIVIVSVNRPAPPVAESPAALVSSALAGSDVPATPRLAPTPAASETPADEAAAPLTLTAASEVPMTLQPTAPTVTAPVGAEAARVAAPVASEETVTTPVAVPPLRDDSGVSAAPVVTPSRPDPVVRQVAQVREIQTRLVALGFDLGRPDGDAGPQTLAAAETFASTHGLADANFDVAFLAALGEAQAGYLVPLGPLQQRDPVLEQINLVRAAQGALNELGFNLGRPDGDAGPRTIAAIEEFAASRSLADANIDPALIALLHEAVDGR